MFNKKLPWLLLFPVLAFLSIWVIISQSKSFSPSAMRLALQNIRVPWLILSIAAVAAYILFEGLALSCLSRGLTGVPGKHGGIVYSAADMFFSAITPSASGGQPASAFFMILDGIPAAQTAVILLMNLIMYIFSLLLCAIVALIARWHVLPEFDALGLVLIGIGVVLLVGLALFFDLMLRKSSLIHRLGLLLIQLGTFLHLLHDPDRYRRKLLYHLEQYQEYAQMIRGKRKALGMAFLMNLLQRLSHSLITVFAYLAMGGMARHVFTVWCVQILVVIGSYCIPIPGAIGVADYLMIKGLDIVKDVMNPANLELFSRGLSFYVCVLLSLIILGIGYGLRVHSSKRKT